MVLQADPATYFISECNKNPSNSHTFIWFSISWPLTALWVMIEGTTRISPTWGAGNERRRQTDGSREKFERLSELQKRKKKRKRQLRQPDAAAEVKFSPGP
jgi:hypothetical protein